LRVEALFTDLWTNTDAIDNEASRRVTDGRYVFLEDGVIPAPTSGEWVATWQPGPSSATDVRRRIPKKSTPKKK
jgi:hypothetical protein